MLLEGVYTVLSGRVVALELLRVHAAHLEIGVPAGALALLPLASEP